MCHGCVQPWLCSVPNIDSRSEAVVLQGGKPEESLQDLACGVAVRRANSAPATTCPPVPWSREEIYPYLG